MTHEKERLPEKVYIQFGEDPPTWCPHRTHEDDVEYTRTPLHGLDEQKLREWLEDRVSFARESASGEHGNPRFWHGGRAAFQGVLDQLHTFRTPSPELPEVLNRFHLTSVIDTAHYNKEISDDLHDRLIKAVRDTSPELPEGVKMVDVATVHSLLAAKARQAQAKGQDDIVGLIRNIRNTVDSHTLTDDEGGRDD